MMKLHKSFLESFLSVRTVSTDVSGLLTILILTNYCTAGKSSWSQSNGSLDFAASTLPGEPICKLFDTHPDMTSSFSMVLSVTEFVTP
jgi:hypothetical protein